MQDPYYGLGGSCPLPDLDPPVPSAALPLSSLVYQVRNSQVMLQQRRAREAAKDTKQKSIKSLLVDLKSGTAKPIMEPLLPEDAQAVLGVAGMLKLEHGSVLVLITKARKVCVLDHPVYKVEATQLITHEAVKKSVKEVRTAYLFQQAFDVHKYGAHLYFSFDEELTQSAQRLAATKTSKGSAPKSSLWSRADKRFVWNRTILQPLVDGGAEDFAIPMIAGYVGQLPEVVLHTPSDQEKGATGILNEVHGATSGQERRCCITLIGRLAVGRAGTRWWRSGLDTEGNTAHFEESEVRLFMEKTTDRKAERNGDAGDDKKTARDGERGVDEKDARIREDESEVGSKHAEGRSRVTTNLAEVSTLSHVQLRGSIPLLWSRLPDAMRPSSTLRLSPDSTTHAAAFSKHVDKLAEVYQNVALLQMSSKDRSAGMMESLLHVLAEQYKKDNKKAVKVVVVPEGGSRSMAQIAGASGRQELRTKLEGWLDEHGMFCKDSESVRSMQTGVVSCCAVEVSDSVDVAQASLADMALEKMLRRQGVLTEGQTLESHYPQVLIAFRTLWANHATVIGDQVNGLGSLGSGVIRTGEAPSLIQSLKNIWLSNERHFHTLFLDAPKQDAIDLLTGGYQYKHASGGLLERANGYTWLQMGAIFALWTLYQVIALTSSGAIRSIAAWDFFIHVGIPGIASIIMIGYVAALGPAYLEHPQLCPELIAPQ